MNKQNYEQGAPQSSPTPSSRTNLSKKNRDAPGRQRPKRENAHFLVGGVILYLTFVIGVGSLGVTWLFSSEGDGYEPFPQLILDVRSLALGRVFLGLLIILDLRERLVDLIPFYSDTGCCPRHVLLAPGGEPRLGPSDISLYFATGANETVALLMLALGGVSSICFLVGYHTRLASFACWVHWRSIETRTVAVHQAGDLLLRLILWWCMFLPMGALYSVDAATATSVYLNGDSIPATTATAADMIVVPSKLAAFGFMLQLALMYFMTVMFKVDSSWIDGSAIRLVLLNFGFSRAPISTWVLSLPSIVTWGLTKATIWMEFAVLPFLLLVSNPSLRLVVAVAVIGFHFGLGMTMRLGLFPAICVAGWCLLLPGFIWDTIGLTLPESGSAHDSNSASQIDGFFWMEDAVMWISIILAVRSNLAKLPTAILRAAIDAKQEKPRVATWIDWTTSMMDEVWCHTRTIQGHYETELGRLLGQNQQWFMFDVPGRTDNWYISVGHCEDGSCIDIFGSFHNGAVLLPVLKSPPPRWQVAYQSHRWRKFLSRLTEKRYTSLRETYAHFIVDQWNSTAAPNKKVVRLELHCVKRRINLVEEQDARLEQSAVMWRVDIKFARA